MIIVNIHHVIGVQLRQTNAPRLFTPSDSSPPLGRIIRIHPNSDYLRTTQIRAAVITLSPSC